MMAAGRPSRRISLDGLIDRFGRIFWFGSARIGDHTALTASRIELSDPGVTCVITPDLAELADALEQDQEDPRAAAIPPVVARAPGRTPAEAGARRRCTPNGPAAAPPPNQGSVPGAREDRAVPNV